MTTHPAIEKLAKLIGCKSDRCAAAFNATKCADCLAGAADVYRHILSEPPSDAMIEAGDELCPVARGTESHRMAGGVVPEDYLQAMNRARLRELGLDDGSN